MRIIIVAIFWFGLCAQNGNDIANVIMYYIVYSEYLRAIFKQIGSSLVCREMQIIAYSSSALVFFSLVI